MTTKVTTSNSRVAWTTEWDQERVWFSDLARAIPGVEVAFDACGNQWARLAGDSERTVEADRIPARVIEPDERDVDAALGERGQKGEKMSLGAADTADPMDVNDPHVSGRLRLPPSGARLHRRLTTLAARSVALGARSYFCVLPFAPRARLLCERRPRDVRNLTCSGGGDT